MDKELCHICGKPIGRFESRFLHMIDHIQEGLAVGTFDGKGNWWFRKTAPADLNSGTEGVSK